MLARLRAILGRRAPALPTAPVCTAPRRMGFPPLGKSIRHLLVCGGRTEYWPAAGQELYAGEPAFRAAVRECEWIMTKRLGGPSVLSHFLGQPEPQLSADAWEARVLQIAAVMQVALVQLLRSRGVRPDAIYGISLGEVAAVYAAGGLALEDAMRVSSYICRLGMTEPCDCAVLALWTSFSRASQLAATCPAGLFIILVADTDNCLAFCTPSDLPAVQSYLASHGIRSQILRTLLSRPYHTTRLHLHRSRLAPALEKLRPRPLSLPCYLSAGGGLVPAGTVLDAGYWPAMCENVVYAAGAAEAALADGHRLWTLVGANPFPFFKTAAWTERLKGVCLQPIWAPGVSEQASFAEACAELRSLGRCI